MTISETSLTLAYCFLFISATAAPQALPSWVGVRLAPEFRRAPRLNETLEGFQIIDPTLSVVPVVKMSRCSPSHLTATTRWRSRSSRWQTRVPLLASV